MFFALTFFLVILITLLITVTFVPPPISLLRCMAMISEMTVEPGMQRIIIHLDMDSFYASVEMHARPEIRAKPVVIGADPNHGKGRGVVSTCSYEARAFGIRSAMPISQAFLLCPHAIYLPPDFSLYAKASAEVMTILRSYGFRFEQVSIDEAYLDVTAVGSFLAVKTLAEKIQETIQTSLGLTCSIGVAPNKLVAKIASDVKKPAGLTVVEPECVTVFLAPMPVRKIPGIGRKSELELLELGVRTIGDLASCDIRKLIARFGRSAMALRDTALGIDSSDVENRDGMKSMSRETTFDSDTDDPDLIARTMDSLAGEVHAGLAGEHLRFKTITVKIRYEGFITRTRARTLPHYTGEKAIIQSSAFSLVRELIDGRKVRLR